MERIHLYTDKRQWRKKPEEFPEKLHNYQFLKGRLEKCSLSHPEGFRIVLIFFKSYVCKLSRGQSLGL
jgi:hypothetical protein